MEKRYIATRQWFDDLENNFISLLKNISEVVISTDEYFKITSLNNAAEEIYGSKTSWLGKDIGTLVPSLIKFVKGLPLEKPKQFDFYDESISRRGSLVPICLRDKTIGFHVILKSGKGTEDHYRMLACATEGIFVFNNTGRLLEVNAKICIMTGYSEAELLKKNLSEIAPVHFRKYGEGFLTTMLEQKGLYAEGELLRKDDSILFVEINTEVTMDGNYVCFCRDITERKRTLIALQESEEKYRMLFQLNPLPLFIVEIQRFHFLDVNDAAINQYGYSKEEFLQMTPFSIWPEEEWAHYCERVRLNEECLVNMGYFKNVKKDGTVMEVEIYQCQFLFNQLPSSLVLAIDVTEKLHDKRELLTTTKHLRELSAHLEYVREEERAKIAREVHDELGQQLTILKMGVSWLNKKLQNLNDTAMLERSEELLDTLNETIQTIRRIAKELRPSLLDDLGLIAAMEWQAQEFEKRSEIKIHFISNLTHLPVSTTVATSLFRIYQEALTNAGRHSQAKNIWASLQLNGNSVLLTIKDDGRGFDTSVPGNKKTLGLLGMRERAIMIGGTFELESTPGEGTTIVICSPLS